MKHILVINNQTICEVIRIKSDYYWSDYYCVSSNNVEIGRLINVKAKRLPRLTLSLTARPTASWRQNCKLRPLNRPGPNGLSLQNCLHQGNLAFISRPTNRQTDKPTDQLSVWLHWRQINHAPYIKLMRLEVPNWIVIVESKWRSEFDRRLWFDSDSKDLFESKITISI